jgi:polysaccharide pyruvyl transferase WcaK-like protein
VQKLAVLNWAGHRNFGDELMLEGLRQLFKGWQITVMSDNYRSSFPKLNFDVVNECDLFVLGGGELINSDRLFSSDLYSLFHSSWVKRVKIPKVILGCGVNAENANQFSSNVIRDLEQFDYIGLRDNASVEILSAIPELKGKVHLFYDLAFAINTDGLTWKPSKDLAVVIPTDRSTCKHDSGIRQFNVAVESCGWLTKKLKPYSETKFLAFGAEDNADLETCKFLSSCASNSEILSPNQLSIELVLRLLSECSFVFPYRLHGLILSFLVGAPCEFYPYHWKLQRVHDTITGYTPEEISLKQKTLFDELII